MLSRDAWRYARGRSGHQKPPRHPVIHQPEGKSGNIVERLLESQQQLTAVEKFSQRYSSVTTPANESQYRDLIPLDGLADGEQYSFEIDLDACSGCKACVAACHSLNGLDEGEIWRNVGLLTGGDDYNPVVQHVTSACHHCVEPACMHGCPVRAYEKDPITGIVEHLDDQCIGCKYCMFTCPYDVPSYSESKGIVRKCNMCTDRLSEGQAPACVQACPHEAIKIRKVSKESIRAEAMAATGSQGSSICGSSALLPGAPSSRLTLPTTRYIGKPKAVSNGKPVDFHVPKAQHAHYPLVFMLTLTQMSLGVFAVALLLRLTGSADERTLAIANMVGFGSLVAGLIVATLHLGRPDKAYRAMSGFRTSWLSREIIGFNGFAGPASALFALSVFSFWPDWVMAQMGLLAWVTVIAGVVAVECSVMLYVVTGRPLWSAVRTHSLFFLTAVVLGLASSILIVAAVGESGATAMRWLSAALVVATGVKLATELNLLKHLKSDESTPEKLSAQSLVSEKQSHGYSRLAVAAVGGVLVPLLLALGLFSANAVLPAAGVLACVFAGEVIERYLFFAVSNARRMPGAPN